MKFWLSSILKIAFFDFYNLKIIFLYIVNNIPIHLTSVVANNTIIKEYNLVFWREM